MAQASITVMVPLNDRTTLKPMTVSSPIAFLPGETRSVGACAYLRLVADGINVPSFIGFSEEGGSSGYVNIAGVVNQIEFVFDGIDVFYTVTQTGAKGSLPPTYLKGTAGNGNLLTCLANVGYAISSYQWVKTSSAGVATAIAGATSSTWMQTGLVPGDSISCIAQVSAYMPPGLVIPPSSIIVPQTNRAVGSFAVGSQAL